MPSVLTDVSANRLLLVSRAASTTDVLLPRQSATSGKNLLDDFAMVEFEAFAARQFEFAGVQAQAAHNGCVDISHVMPVLDGVETQFVRHAALDAAPNA